MTMGPSYRTISTQVTTYPPYSNTTTQTPTLPAQYVISTASLGKMKYHPKSSVLTTAIYSTYSSISYQIAVAKPSGQPYAKYPRLQTPILSAHYDSATLSKNEIKSYSEIGGYSMTMAPISHSTSYQMPMSASTSKAYTSTYPAPLYSVVTPVTPTPVTPSPPPPVTPPPPSPPPVTPPPPPSPPQVTNTTEGSGLNEK